MAAHGSITADIAGWLTPRRALEILDAVFETNHLSKSELIRRLRGGMVTAICHHVTIDGQKLKANVLNLIGSDDWDQIYADNDVWETGTLTGTYRESGNYSGPKTIRFFDTRFNPNEIEMIVAPLRPTATQATNQPATEPQSEPAPKVRLPDPLLEAWFEFYKKIGGEMREDPATAHVQRCFPNNSVARQRIRDLLPPRPMGRPKTGDG